MCYSGHQMDVNCIAYSKSLNMIVEKHYDDHSALVQRTNRYEFGMEWNSRCVSHRLR